VKRNPPAPRRVSSAIEAYVSELRARYGKRLTNLNDAFRSDEKHLGGPVDVARQTNARVQTAERRPERPR